MSPAMRPWLLSLPVIATVVAVTLLACKDSSAPSADDASGRDDGAAEDAPTSDGTFAPAACSPPDASPGKGTFGTWYRPNELPVGPCQQLGCNIELDINTCCDEPNTPELAMYRCTCAASGWRCDYVYGGAGVCGDGSAGSYFGDEGCASH
jgi:hypothetical protein